MKKKILLITNLFLLLVTVSSCKKFLDIDTSSNTTINPHTVADFEEILNAPGICQPNYFLVDMTADDFTIGNTTNKSTLLWRLYSWQEELLGPAAPDPIFNDSYKWIMHMNLVIEKMPTAPEGTPERQAIAIAQAKIHRAYYYLQLVNIYGPSYSANTAHADLGVPLVTTVSSTEVHARATVQQVYDLILSDLNDALNTVELPLSGNNIIHPGRIAALALRTRVYLLMGNYPKALESADATLKLKNTLMDYAALETKPYELLDYQSNPETLLARTNAFQVQTYGANMFYIVNRSITDLLDNGDLRLELNTEAHDFIADAYTYLPIPNSQTYSFDYSVTVPEIMLIKAECLARANDATGAISTINTLRQKRFYPEDFVPIDQNVSAAEALREVLNERRRELFLHGGLRLFDVKRLGLGMARESMFGGPLSSVPPQPAGSKRFVLPFAQITLSLNNKLIQNER